MRESSFEAACCFCESMIWPYIFNVVLVCACPIMPETVFKSTLSESNNETVVCRNAWGEKSPISFSLQKSENHCVKLSDRPIGF